MAIYSYDNINPKIGKKCFIAKSADVIGKVTLGDEVSIWFNCVVRGDVNDIEIGKCTNVQDLSVLHVTEKKFPLKIGKCVTIGHSVTLHGCEIGDNTLVGMGAIILDGVKVGQNSVVAAGSLLPEGKEFPDKVLIKGSPAKVSRDLTEEEINMYGNHYKTYIKTSSEYLQPGFVREVEI